MKMDYNIVDNIYRKIRNIEFAPEWEKEVMRDVLKERIREKDMEV